MTEQTFYRGADVPKGEAVKQLLDRNPGATVVRVDSKRASPSEARFAGVRTGTEIYAATIRLAEEDDSEKKDDTSEDSASESSGSEAPKDVDVDLDIAPDSGGEEGGDAPEGLEGLGDEGGEDAPEELKGDDAIIDLLKQLLDAVKGGDSLGEDPLADPALGDPALGDPALGGDLPPGGDVSVLPDIGAPVPGEALPPPVPPKGGPGAFASVQAKVASVGSAELVLQDVTGDIKTKDIVAQAHADFPGHRVAKVRREGWADIKGTNVHLPTNEIALVTLVKK